MNIGASMNNSGKELSIAFLPISMLILFLVLDFIFINQ